MAGAADLGDYGTGEHGYWHPLQTPLASDTVSFLGNVLFLTEGFFFSQQSCDHEYDLGNGAALAGLVNTLAMACLDARRAICDRYWFGLGSTLGYTTQAMCWRAGR